MTADPAQPAPDPAPTNPQDQINNALAKAEQAVADLTSRVSQDLKNLREQVAAENTDTAGLIERIDAMVISIEQVDPAQAIDPSPAPAAPSAPTRPVYTFDGDPGSVDPNTWQSAPFKTADGRQLYTYAGDTEGSPQAMGDGLAGVWHVYTGETQPA